jgi:hypothetical protein
MTTNFTSWPGGELSKQLQRPELEQVRAAGYPWKDARDLVETFERKVADFAGARYGVAVDCCSHGLFLCLKYLQAQLDTADVEVTIERIALANQKTTMTSLDQFKVNRRIDFAMKS